MMTQTLFAMKTLLCKGRDAWSLALTNISGPDTPAYYMFCGFMVVTSLTNEGEQMMSSQFSDLKLGEGDGLSEARTDGAAGGGSSDGPSKIDVGKSEQDMTKSECRCESRNGTCNKVVDGKIVASLTPIMNSVTGRQELCDPNGTGGFENLCNQPQLKCP